MENTLGSERAAVVGVIDPVSQGVGATSTAWIDMSRFDQILAIIKTGVLGAAATLDGKLEQATDAAGAGAKDITGKAITQLVKASNDDDQAVINCRAEELDAANDFRFARLTLTVAAAASIIDGTVLGMGARYAPASDFDLASVQEIVA